VTFHIVVPARNAAALIGRCVDSIRGQACRDWTCTIVDDRSTDTTAAAARRACRGDSRFDVVVNPARLYALGSAVEAFRRLRPAPGDVCVAVDGDDTLTGPDVLDHVADAYADANCLLTYGSYVTADGKRGRECAAYPDSVLARGQVRRAPWHATHLRTFRCELLPRVPDAALTVSARELRSARRWALLTARWRAWRRWRSLAPGDLLSPDGRYVRRCCDRALMFPLLELARTRSRFLDKPLYCYFPAAPDTPRPPPAKWYPRCIRAVLRRKPALPAAEAIRFPSPAERGRA
jgi:glycosyltransferase involved in cell wall biosynthesis